LVVADLPFLTYHVGEDEAVRNAGRLLKEGGATAVKLEGGAEVAPVVKRLVQAGIPVMGHLGLTPQSVNRFGGFRVQAREPVAARKLLEDARALEAAGAFGIVLELVPSEVSAVVSGALTIPTIGIGAGPHCDGEVQVIHDLLGLYEGASRRHAKCYVEAGKAIREALTVFTEEVRRGEFPSEANTVHAPELEDSATWEG
jgi:3-methyl-2-oxobutanoate hydroxymethyltransferase